MIRINLLGVDRQKAKRVAAFDVGKQITLASSLILVLAAAGIGYWYWSLTQESARVDAEIQAAQTEVARLRGIITEVSKFEARRAQLQQRVALIEELRKGQSIPVQLLDQVSRSLPEMLWLTAMKQEGADVTIEGRSTTLMGLSDFVGNLSSNPFFKRPIEILSSMVEAAPATAGGAAPELIRFTVKATLATAPASGGPPAGRR
jgi:type IV pilus assembly protein PilN